jgi:soluble lytic murein transglycosylase
MQIMPATARQTFQNLVKRKIVSKDASYNFRNLYDNLTLGISHICDLIEKYKSNMILISAAYNCGEGNLDKWIKKLGTPGQYMPSFVWIELIPFWETRNYVKKVIESFVVYSHLLQTEYLQNTLWPLF